MKKNKTNTMPKGSSCCISLRHLANILQFDVRDLRLIVVEKIDDCEVAMLPALFVPSEQFINLTNGDWECFGTAYQSFPAKVEYANNAFVFTYPNGSVSVKKDALIELFGQQVVVTY